MIEDALKRLDDKHQRQREQRLEHLVRYTEKMEELRFRHINEKVNLTARMQSENLKKIEGEIKGLRSEIIAQGNLLLQIVDELRELTGGRIALSAVNQDHHHKRKHNAEDTARNH